MLKISTKELGFVEKSPLDWLAGSSPACVVAAAGAGPILGLTRSAHDLGGALTGGGVASSVGFVTAFSSPAFVEIVAFADLSRFSPFDGIAGFSASEATLASVFFDPLDGSGMLGIAGRIGKEGMIG